MGQRPSCCGLGAGGEQPGFSFGEEKTLLPLHLSIRCLLASKDPVTHWLTHKEMENRGCALLCYCTRVFPGFRVWWGHTGQRAGRAALPLYVSELWNRAQLYWPSVCLIKLCTINGSASWDRNRNPQETFQQIWFEFQVAVKHETRWVSCTSRFCWKPFNQF